MVRARCLCGAIACSVTGELERMSHCHCSMCRKAHGAAFATYVATTGDRLHWLSGEGRATAYESSPGNFRTFCPTCGSVAPTSGTGPERVFIPAGLLEEDPGARPEAHLFVASKAPWYEIADELPRFDVLPPGIDFKGIDRPQRATTSGAGGSCLCGAVSFVLLGKVDVIVHCHCSRCRKARAAAHASNLFVDPQEFRWISGEELVVQYRLPGAQRFGTAFCRVCGGAVPRALPGAPRINVPAGALDDDPGARPRLHIYCGSKAPWFEVADDLPKFEEAPS